MIKATINGIHEFTVQGTSLNGTDANWDLLEIKQDTFSILKDNKSYNATLISFNPEEKTMLLNVNGNEYEVAIKDKNDLLLQQLGINIKTSSAVQTIKAPMPGLILSIAVNIGDEVKKGDTLLILEAMKMENVLKSPRDGKIKRVSAQLKQAVEKNQLLIEFE